MMSLSTQSHRIQSKGWTKISKNLNQNILWNVGKGWFSRVDCRGRNWPFWSYCTFMFGWNRRGVVRAALQYPCLILSLPDT